MLSLIHATTSGADTIFLTSPRNPLLKEIRGAVARGSLTSDGCFIAETFHLVEEAVRSRAEIRTVIASETVAERAESSAPGWEIVVVPDAVFRELAATESNQGVMAVVRPREWRLADLAGSRGLLVILDRLQDPGNTGAIVRATEAFGGAGLILLKGSASPYNPKAVRASAGSIFRLPIVVHAEPEGVSAWLRDSGIPLYAAAGDGELELYDAEFGGPAAAIIGNEGQGVSAMLRANARGVRIPVEKVESLNAAMAAGILLYEAARQRRSGS